MVQWVTRRELRRREERMSFERQTAGRMMSLRFVPVHEGATVAEAIAQLQAADPAERVSVLYVVDDPGRLIGIVPIGRLVKAEPLPALQRVARAPVVSVTPDVPQDEVARLSLRHRVWIIPVVDRERRPMGIVTGAALIHSIRERVPRNRLLRRQLDRLTRPRPARP
jgi:magnesium transporter